jgi:hypothetical protein
LESPDDDLIIPTQFRVWNGRAVGFEQKNAWFKRRKNGVALRHTELFQELASERFLGEMCLCSGSRHINTDKTMYGAVVSAIKSGEKCGFKGSSSVIVIEWEQNIVNPVHDLNVMLATRGWPFPEGLRTVDLSEPVIGQEAL